jgi:hypothetical protein
MIALLTPKVCALDHRNASKGRKTGMVLGVAGVQTLLDARRALRNFAKYSVHTLGCAAFFVGEV